MERGPMNYDDNGCRAAHHHNGRDLNPMKSSGGRGASKKIEIRVKFKCFNLFEWNSGN